MDDGSQFVATKTLLFSPLYSNYIFFYGMPEYGVGFDPNKVNFIQRLLDLIAQENKTPDVTVEEEIGKDITILESNLLPLQ